MARLSCLLLGGLLVALSCTQADSLVEVTVNSPEASYQGLRLGLSANGGAWKYYRSATVTPTQPFRAGFYLPGSLVGTVDFQATVDDGTCVLAKGNPDPTPAFDVASGKKVALQMILKPVPGGCDSLPPSGGQGGSGGPDGTAGAGAAGSAGSASAGAGGGGLASTGGLGGAVVVGTGGIIGGGGIAGTGGVVGTGGLPGTGGIVGTGGVKGSGGLPGTGACGAVIDDMEAHTGRICQGNGRNGLWFTYVDSSTGDTITPAPGTSALPEKLSTPRTTSQYAMHISGTFSEYAGFGCWLDNTSFSAIPIPYDGSAYTGVRFWARGKGSMRVTGQIPATESSSYGGTCTATSCTPSSYVVGDLSADWIQVDVPFSLLTGGLSPFKSAQIWSLEFGFSTSTATTSTFDLWIDDLTFY